MLMLIGFSWVNNPFNPIKLINFKGSFFVQKIKEVKNMRTNDGSN